MAIQPKAYIMWLRGGTYISYCKSISIAWQWQVYTQWWMWYQRMLVSFKQAWWRYMIYSYAFHVIKYQLQCKTRCIGSSLCAPSWWVESKGIHYVCSLIERLIEKKSDKPMPLKDKATWGVFFGYIERVWLCESTEWTTANCPTPHSSVPPTSWPSLAKGETLYQHNPLASIIVKIIKCPTPKPSLAKKCPMGGGTVCGSPL